VSADSFEGSQGKNPTSQVPSISGDGHAVAYESDATNLVRPDSNRTTDAYLTRLTGLG
jgi:hypothetical protein